jgi:hypothetical protein
VYASLIPCVEPDAKGEDVVNPFLWVALVVILTRDGLAT